MLAETHSPHLHLIIRVIYFTTAKRVRLDILQTIFKYPSIKITPILDLPLLSVDFNCFLSIRHWRSWWVGYLIEQRPNQVFGNERSFLIFLRLMWVLATLSFLLKLASFPQNIKESPFKFYWMAFYNMSYRGTHVPWL